MYTPQREEKTEWRRKYAYLPKKINGVWVWRDAYYVREVYGPHRLGNSSYIDWMWTKEYGTIFDVISTDR